MSQTLFIVEGPHDLETVACLLKPRGFSRIKQLSELPQFWFDLVPKTFPHGGDLLSRVPVPTFFQSKDDSVAIHSAIGLEKIVKTLATSLMQTPELPGGIGIVLDADTTDSPAKRWRQLLENFKKFDPIPELDWGPGPGKLGNGPVRCGIFVLPDNQNSGTLENVLLECARQVYPELHRLANEYVEAIAPDDAAVLPDVRDRSDYKKPAGRLKATAGAIASILRPGKALQVSIQDNNWLRHEKAFELASVLELLRFIEAIVGGDMP